MSNKRSILEDRQRRWMEDRDMTLRKSAEFQSSSAKSNHNHQVVDAKNSSTIGVAKVVSNNENRGGLSKANNIEPGDDFFDKLTQKLAGHIKEEIKREMKGSIHNSDIRDVVADKMESYLNAELHTHTCKICEEVMRSPDKTPMILFPCGHTFCKLCIHGSNNRRRNECPYCRRVDTFY